MIVGDSCTLKCCLKMIGFSSREMGGSDTQITLSTMISGHLKQELSKTLPHDFSQFQGSSPKIPGITWKRSRVSSEITRIIRIRFVGMKGKWMDRRGWVGRRTRR